MEEYFSSRHVMITFPNTTVDKTGLRVINLKEMYLVHNLDDFFGISTRDFYEKAFRTTFKKIFIFLTRLFQRFGYQYVKRYSNWSCETIISLENVRLFS